MCISSIKITFGKRIKRVAMIPRDQTHFFNTMEVLPRCATIYVFANDMILLLFIKWLKPWYGLVMLAIAKFVTNTYLLLPCRLQGNQGGWTPNARYLKVLKASFWGLFRTNFSNLIY